MNLHRFCAILLVVPPTNTKVALRVHLDCRIRRLQQLSVYNARSCCNCVQSADDIDELCRITSVGSYYEHCVWPRSKTVVPLDAHSVRLVFQRAESRLRPNTEIGFPWTPNNIAQCFYQEQRKLNEGHTRRLLVSEYQAPSTVDSYCQTVCT